MPEIIDSLLKELKLPAFVRHYKRHQEPAIENGHGHIRYLSGLCEQEVADRYQKRVHRWTQVNEHQRHQPRRARSFQTF